MRDVVAYQSWSHRKRFKPTISSQKGEVFVGGSQDATLDEKSGNREMPFTIDKCINYLWQGVVRAI